MSSPARPLMIVCSSGGHLLQMLELRAAWSAFERVWVTFDKSDARSLLRGERVVHAYGPTNRNIPNLLRNLRLAWRVLRDERPAAILTTGAGVAVPFAWLGRLLGIPTFYVESVTRIEGLSLSAPADRAGRHAHVCAVARAGRRSPAGASSSRATSSRADDRRHRRHHTSSPSTVWCARPLSCR